MDKMINNNVEYNAHCDSKFVDVVPNKKSDQVKLKYFEISKGKL